MQGKPLTPMPPKGRNIKRLCAAERIITMTEIYNTRHMHFEPVLERRRMLCKKAEAA